MYFLLVFQLISADVGNWVQLGAYESEEQCKAIAQVVREDSSVKYICAPSRAPGKKV